jgi:glycosyltransferase involved in cell wall biosynthesis
MAAPCLQFEVRPRVLFFSTYVSRESGASHALRMTVRRVAARGVKPVVVVPDAEDSYELFPTREFDAVYLRMQRPRRTWDPRIHARALLASPGTLRSLRRLIRERGIDLVHFNELTDCIAGLAGKSCGVPCVCHVRTARPPNPYRWLLLATVRRTADAIVVPSLSTAGWIGADARDLAGRIRLVYDFAFDMKEYEHPVSGLAFRHELGLPADAVLVTLVSKLVLQKGHQCFIRAAEKVRKSGKNIYFALVGGPVPGHEGEAAAIKALAEKLVPAPALRILGPRADLPAVYSASDLVVHCPTYADPYPTVVLLPMLAGRCVIGSSIGGIPEQIDPGKTGVLVPADDPGALGDAILSLARDAAKRDALGAAAQQKLRESFAPETQSRCLSALYGEVIERRTRRKQWGLEAARARKGLSERDAS